MVYNLYELNYIIMRAKLTQTPINYKPYDEVSFLKWYTDIKRKAKHSYLNFNNHAIYYKQEQ
jgi:hypothetical protein